MLNHIGTLTVEVAEMSKSAAMLEIGRDAVVLAGGIALVLVTPWLNTSGDREVTGSLLVLGLLLAGTALWAMGSTSRTSHWVHLIVGILVLISPWMLQFPAGVDTADLVAVVVGITATAAGVLGIIAARRAHARATAETTRRNGSYLAW